MADFLLQRTSTSGVEWRPVSVAARRGSGNTVEESNSMKPARQSIPKARGCRGCPYRAPAGRCLDPVLKSGRCGDYVWYVLGGSKQCRRRWVKPKDPRSLRQRRWRTRLGAASSKYSHSLTDEQQDACNAEGAKRRSRPRLDQSGRLTGQQHFVGKECAGNAGGGKRKVTMVMGKVPQSQRLTQSTHLQVPQPQRITRATWEIHGGISGTPPGHSRWDTGRGSKNKGRRKNGECRRQKARAVSEVRQAQRVTRSRWERHRSTPWAMHRQAARNLGILPVSRRASVRARPSISRPPASQGSRGRSPSRRRYGGCVRAG